MAAFDPGTGGTLKSTTLEDAFLEGFQLLNAAEAALANNPGLTSMNFDTDAGIATMTASLPVATSVAADGSINVAAFTTGYVTNAFNPGSPAGDVASTTLLGAVIEMAQLLQATENTQQADDNVQVSIDGNTGRFSITAALPITLGVNSTSGKVEITATEYLS